MVIVFSCSFYFLPLACNVPSELERVVVMLWDVLLDLNIKKRNITFSAS